MAICSAYGCGNRSNGKRKLGVSFHKFPQDNLVRKRWVEAVRRSNWEPGAHSILCSEHFSVEFLNRTSACGRTELRENAVPTIFSDYPAHLQPPKIRKIRKPPHPRATKPEPKTAAEPIPIAAAEPLPQTVSERIKCNSEEQIEISEPSSKDVAVQVSGDNIMKELVNQNKHLEWKFNALRSKVHEKSILLKKVRKQNVRLNVRISSLKSSIKELISSEKKRTMEFEDKGGGDKELALFVDMSLLYPQQQLP